MYYFLICIIFVFTANKCSDSNGIQLTTTSGQLSSEFQNNLAQKDYDQDSNNSLISRLLIPAGLAVTSSATAFFLYSGTKTPKRGLLDAGDIVGAAGTTKAVGFIAAIIAGSYWTGRFLNGLHYGCRADQERLEQTFERKLEEIIKKLEKKLEDSKKEYTENINRIFDNYNAKRSEKDADIINIVNKTIIDQQEETHGFLHEMADSIRLCLQSLPKDTQDAEGIRKAAKNLELLQKEIDTLKNLQAKNPLDPNHYNQTSLTTNEPRKKSFFCC
ncbi:hypothetical protein HYV10_01745 [Candidatus Dependentiae bacterium]|nr:hypothetical protein [Candidatus Dependentiae bacterium]